MILSEQTRMRVLQEAWSAYASIQKSIDALASIGLDLDGGSDGTSTGCQKLYGAMTSAANIILSCCGIPRGTVQAEQLDMFLSQTASEADPADRNSMKKSLDRILASAIDMRDTHIKNGMRVPWGGKPGLYEVTVTMTGGIQAAGTSIQDAMAAVDGMDTDQLLEQAAWDSPSATDAREP